MIALKYISDETRRFVTFVANRAAIIQKESEPRQWRHVRSEHNPADYASRGIKASEIKKLERYGAEFLWKNEDELPPQPTEASEALLDSDEGVKRAKITVGAAVVQKDFRISLFQRCSKWGRLRRLVACLIRVFHRLHIQNYGLNKAKVRR